MSLTPLSGRRLTEADDWVSSLAAILGISEEDIDVSDTDSESSELGDALSIGVPLSAAVRLRVLLKTNAGQVRNLGYDTVTFENVTVVYPGADRSEAVVESLSYSTAPRCVRARVRLSMSMSMSM